MNTETPLEQLAEAILKKHFEELVKSDPDKYYTFEQMKAQKSEYGTMIAAMTEIAGKATTPNVGVVYVPTPLEEKPEKDGWYTLVTDGGIDICEWYDAEDGWAINDVKHAYSKWLKKTSTQQGEIEGKGGWSDEVKVIEEKLKKGKKYIIKISEWLIQFSTDEGIGVVSLSKGKEMYDQDSYCDESAASLSPNQPKSEE